MQIPARGSAHGLCCLYSDATTAQNRVSESRYTSLGEVMEKQWDLEKTKADESFRAGLALVIRLQSHGNQ